MTKYYIQLVTRHFTDVGGPLVSTAHVHQCAFLCKGNLQHATWSHAGSLLLERKKLP